MFLAVSCVSGAAHAVSGSGDSATAALETVPPLFSGLIVSPPQAAQGEIVTLQFSASEALEDDPVVTVNGNPATRTAKTAYSYEYIVLGTDPLGPVDIAVSGFDLLGNPGAASAPAALTILPLAPQVPLRAWPAGVALLAVGVLALARQRKVCVLLVLALLAAPMAMAATPTVTNVSVVQSAAQNNTQVVITYDLVSPNGPSNITVALSKNGGGDGFSFPVTSVTGAIFGVTTGTGKQIVWELATDYPNENIPNARLRVTAEDGITQYTLTYAAGAGGTISGTTPQTLNAGGSGTAVTAQPDAGFHFAYWSDGSTVNPRTDIAVSANLSVAASFAADQMEMISVPGGSFDMGNSGSGDDAAHGGTDELPMHTVTLSAYQIGKYEVTNQQLCDVLNYAIDSSRNYLRDGGDAPWSGTGDIYVGADLARILAFNTPECNIQFSAGTFSPKTRVGLPGSTSYSTGSQPAVEVTWCGAVYFCNWLSEMEGLTPVYDPTMGWAANLANNGYHLPTEAQWERAAAWDGAKHWTYGYVSDSFDGTKANSLDETLNYVNPLGLVTFPFTSPTGWFNGTNLSPLGNVATTYGTSPVGCYDMGGNVWEWCHDGYLDTYYATSPSTDPEGSTGSSRRVFRGGGWGESRYDTRTAQRNSGVLSYASVGVGFRIAK